MRRSVDATARGAVRRLRLDAAAAERLRQESPAAARQLMAMVARQLAVRIRAANATIDRLEGRWAGWPCVAGFGQSSPPFRDRRGTTVA